VRGGRREQGGEDGRAHERQAALGVAGATATPFLPANLTA
jgi:hypothetical protein